MQRCPYEPFAGVDPVKSAVLRRLIRTWGDEGRVVLFVEHIRSAAMRQVIEETADRLILLHEGRIQLDGPPHAVLDHQTFHKVYVGENDAEAHANNGRKLTHPSAETALEFTDLDVSYNGASVLKVDHLTVPREAFTLVIGPNGSGKSTLLGSIHGVGAKVKGDVRVFDKPAQRLRPDQIARSGVAVVPQKRKIFADLTVVKNLRIAASTLSPSGRRRASAFVNRYFPLSKERASQRAGTLSSGEQAQLALALALTRSPQILLADELSIGLDATRSNQLQDLLEEWSASGGTVLLAEQNYQHALKRCDEVVAPQSGRMVWRSEPSGLTSEMQEALFAGRELRMPKECMTRSESRPSFSVGHHRLVDTCDKCVEPALSKTSKPWGGVAAGIRHRIDPFLHLNACL